MHEKQIKRGIVETKEPTMNTIKYTYRQDNLSTENQCHKYFMDSFEKNMTSDSSPT